MTEGLAPHLNRVLKPLGENPPFGGFGGKGGKTLAASLTPYRGQALYFQL